MSIMMAKDAANCGVYQFNIPRRDPPTEGGMTVTPAMGGANGINFQSTGTARLPSPAIFW
jgi:hypothetical protein